VEKGQGATVCPTDDGTDVRGPRQRETPGLWSRRVSTVPLPSPAPNHRVLRNLLRTSGYLTGVNA